MFKIWWCWQVLIHVPPFSFFFFGILLPQITTTRLAFVFIVLPQNTTTHITRALHVLHVCVDIIGVVGWRTQSASAVACEMARDYEWRDTSSEATLGPPLHFLRTDGPTLSWCTWDLPAPEPGQSTTVQQLLVGLRLRTMLALVFLLLQRRRHVHNEQYDRCVKIRRLGGAGQHQRDGFLAPHSTVWCKPFPFRSKGEKIAEHVRQIFT